MSVKLFTKTKDVRERKILAASLDMFEIWVNDELVLWPISKGCDSIKHNNEVYKTIFNVRKVMTEMIKEKTDAS